VNSYEKTEWIDHVVDPENSEVVQEGTRFTAKKMNKMEQGIYEAHEQMNVQRANADIEIQGRTLVNLLGRAGSAIYQQDWTYSASLINTFTNDTFVISGANGTISKVITTVIGQKYMLGYFKNGVYINTTFTASGISYTVTIAVVIGDVLKDVRVYAVDAAETDFSNATYPYVDDVKCVVNPYVESTENMFDGANWLAQALTYPIPTQAAGAREISSKYIRLSAGKYTVSIGDLDTVLYGARIVLYTKDIIVNTLCGGISNSYNTTSPIVTDYIPNSIMIEIIGIGYADLGITFHRKGISDTDVSYNNYLISALNGNSINPTLVKGATPKTYHECHNSRIMFETTLYSGEKISRQNNGTYVKNSEMEEISRFTDYTLIWTETYNKTDYACLCVHMKELKNFGTPFALVDYAGKLVTWRANDASYSYWVDSAMGILYFMFPNTLTGWGDAYTPTADEIKAFFLGWRMYNKDTANGTTNIAPLYVSGSKAWIKLWCGIGISYTCTGSTVKIISGSDIFTTAPTTLNEQGYTPYRLVYKKAVPTLEEVKVHGALDKSNDSVITVGSGLVLGERSVTQSTGVINASDFGKFRYRAATILSVSNSTYRLPFVNSIRTGAEAIILAGLSYATTTELYTPVVSDYLIYKPDTVQSFDYIITTPTELKEAVEKLVEDNSSLSAELAADKRELVRTNYELAQRSNPNLLINGDFVNWNRGVTFTGSGGISYTADRWCSANTTAVAKTLDGLSLTGNDTWVGQFIEMTSKAFDALGNYLTLSFYIKSNTPHNGFAQTSRSTLTGVLYAIEGKGSWERVVVVIQKKLFSHYINHLPMFVYRNTTGTEKTVEIKNVKLELGEFATPFVPNNPAEELLACQRYYQQVSPTEVAISRCLANQVTAYWPLRTVMRLVPTLTTSAVSVTDIALNVNATITSTTLSANSTQVAVTAIGTFTPTKTYAIVALGMWAEAEIY